MEKSDWYEPVKKNAVLYARQGWCVVPLWHSTPEGCGCGDPLCNAPGMHPIKSIVSSARNSEDEVISMFSGYPSPNVGIVTGTASRLVALVLDNDGEMAVDLFEQLRNIFGITDKTAEIFSTQKRTLLYRLPPSYPVLPRRITNERFPGLELRGEGNYVEAPPSIDGFGDETYRWVRIEPVADITPQVLEHFFLNSPATKFTYPKTKLTEPEAKEYLRDFYIFFRNRGMSIDEATQITVDQAKVFNQPWNEDDIYLLLQEVEMYTPQEPEDLQFPWTQMQWVNFMVRLADGNVKFVSEENTYRWYRNEYWQPVTPEVVENQLYREVLRRSYGLIPSEWSDKINKMYQRLGHYQRADTIRKVNKMFRFDPAIRTSIEKFDIHQGILPCTNGSINLHTGTLYPSFDGDMCSRVIGTHFDGKATCPQWMRFINFVTGEDDDLSLYLQMVVGYLLGGGNPLEKMFILYGPEGTGKTTFISILQHLFGSFVRRTSISTFADTSSVRNGLASLKGARLVIVDENDGEDSGFLSTPLLKQVISGEKVEARFLYREHFEFEVTFKILIATNYLPAFKIFDDALKRRIIVIPFVNKVSPEHYDPTLGERLEEELPGILNWALEGVELLKKYGLHLPFLLQKELHEYSLNFNSIRRFLEAACIEDHSSQMASNDLYQLYCLYCKAYGEGRPMKHKSFSMRIKEAGYSKSRRKDGVFFMGIRQKDKYHLASEWGLSIENFQ